jgi:hypothetical protein
MDVLLTRGDKMKSYQRALLSATLLALASSESIREGAKKKKESHEEVKKPINRDWLCDKGKKNVGKVKCYTCKNSLRRRKHCSVCNPKVVEVRLAKQELSYKNGPIDVSPIPREIEKTHERNAFK